MNEIEYSNFFITYGFSYIIRGKIGKNILTCKCVNDVTLWGNYVMLGGVNAHIFITAKI